MAVRIQNGSRINFGVFATATIITHIGFTKGSVTIVKELDSSIAIAANSVFELEIGDIDLLFPSVDFPDSYIQSRIWPDWNNQTWRVDARTDATTVVASSGYAPVDINNWTVSTESD